MSDERRTEIVPEPLPVDPNIYHVYLDMETGEIGDRKSLVIMALNRSEVQKMKNLSHNQRIAFSRGRRYFGDVAEASISDVPNA